MLRTSRGLHFVVGVFLSIALQPAAYALAVSDAQLNSHLNQLLDAKILLLSATPEELENLSLLIKRPNEGKNNVTRWPGVNIEVIQNNEGEHFLHVTSEQPVTEPVLNFTLELDWSSGRLQREYVLLIDPKLG